MTTGEHVPEQRGGTARAFLSVVALVATVGVLTLALRTFVFVPYEIPSGSMETTIMTGDMVFSEKVSYYMRQPARGDIVTFADPDVAGRTLIKRVIATEGQTVDIVAGKMVVDGEELDEPYTNGLPSYPLERQAPNTVVEFPYTVPEGCVWVMGDNRTSSQDSRYFGAIPVNSISGRAAFVYWPLKDIGALS